MPYAVALGVERKYTRQLAGLQATVASPHYSVPAGGHGSGDDAWSGWIEVPLGGPGAPAYASSGDDPLSDWTAASDPAAAVNAANADLTGMVNSLNSGLTGMVNDAASVFTFDSPSPHSNDTSDSSGGGDSHSGDGGDSF